MSATLSSVGAADPSIRPLLAVTVAFLGALLVAASPDRPAFREWLTVLVALCQFGLVSSMVPAVLAGRRPVTTLGTFVPGVEFAFRADPLGLLFALVASGLWVLTTVYSVGYLRGTGGGDQRRYYAALGISLGAAVGVAFATNLLVLVLFYELMTIGTYPLVVHEETETARRAGYEYLAYVIGGGTVALGGAVVVFHLAGDVTFVSGGVPGVEAAAATDPWLARAAFAILVVGFGVKAAVMPLHGWLPSAMVAPTPVSGILHAVAVVKSGAFGIARVVLEVFGPETAAALGVAGALAAVAAATIVLASLLALGQDNLKRRLAYSTIAQLSYIVLGVSLLTPAAVTGGLVHLPAHAVAKLTLFFCAGVLYVELGIENVSELAGVGRRLPLTMGAFAVGSLSIATLPLFAGFVSKWHLVLGGGALEGSGPLVLAVLVCSSVLSVAYLWPVVYAALFETPADADPKPVVSGPLGGRAGERSQPSAEETGARADGSVPKAADRVGPPPDASGTRAVVGPDWTPQIDRREASPSLLYPTLATAALVVAIGIVPGELAVLELARLVAESATGTGVLEP